MSNLKKIQSNIKWIATTASKVNERIHETAMLIMQQAKEHGDCSYAQHLFNAMPRSMRRLTLKAWFEQFSPIRFQVKDGDCAKVGMLKEIAKGYVSFDLEAADETPFWAIAEATPEKPELDFAALVKMVERLAPQIEKKIEEGKIVPEDVESAKAIARTLQGLTFNRVAANASDNTNEQAQAA